MGRSIGGSFHQNAHWTLQVLGGGVIGGTTNSLLGGSFLDGAYMGMITTGLNHAMHAIGAPYRLEFDGEYIYVIKGGKIIAKFSAVSGRPLEDGTFDYSAERQLISNEGPIPEGAYFINSNKTQKWEDLSLLQKTAAIFGKGRFPGGAVAWGSERVDIIPKNNNPFEVRVRYGFTIHGGAFPGSAGCIDLTTNDRSFFSMIRNKGIMNLTVKY